VTLLRLTLQGHFTQSTG